MLPLVAVLALGMGACKKKYDAAAAEAEAKQRERVALEETNRHMEQQRRELEKRRVEAQRSAAVYGGPPPRDAGASDAAAKTCNCPPGDPLCSCL